MRSVVVPQALWDTSRVSFLGSIWRHMRQSLLRAHEAIHGPWWQCACGWACFSLSLLVAGPPCAICRMPVPHSSCDRVVMLCAKSKPLIDQSGMVGCGSRTCPNSPGLVRGLCTWVQISACQVVTPILPHELRVYACEAWERDYQQHLATQALTWDPRHQFHITESRSKA